MALATAILGSLANVIISKCEEVSSSIMVLYSGLGTPMVFLRSVIILGFATSRERKRKLYSIWFGLNYVLFAELKVDTAL